MADVFIFFRVRTNVGAAEVTRRSSKDGETEPWARLPPWGPKCLHVYRQGRLQELTVVLGQFLSAAISH